MSGQFTHLTRCLDLQEKDVSDAIGSRDATRALLSHLSDISAPNTGVAKALLVFSRMGTTACGWIDGDLCVDIVGRADTTVIEASTELGGGLRERLLPPIVFRAPIVEFTRAIDRVPHVIAPLGLRTKAPQRVSLSSTDLARRTTAPPPPIEISSDSLFVLRTPVPRVPQEANEAPSWLPNEVDSGWDE